MRCTFSKSRPIAIAAAVVLIAGCRGGGAGSSPMLPVSNLQRAQTASGPLAKHKIDHIVIIIQENRSLENLFYGYPGAMTKPFGFGHLGQKIAMQQVSLKTHWDFVHGAAQFLLACNGNTGKKRGSACKMNGFDELPLVCHNKNQAPCHPPKDPAYSYVPHSEIVPYLDMAHQYVLAAKMFASDFDMSSFISHQYIIAGINPDSSVNYPQAAAWGCPAGTFKQGNKLDELLPNRYIKTGALTPCWKHIRTIGSELDKKGLSWAYYATAIPASAGPPSAACGSGSGPDVIHGVAGIWSAYQTMWGICYGSDWDNDVISPSSQVITDVEAGKLRNVTWITPRFNDSDHPANFSDTGPSWVASVVNAIGKSKFWSSTAIFIFWDDPGGWYDPVAPKYINDDSLGFRLPLLIISPYAKKGYVSQVDYEHGSILRFIEDRFGLAQLAGSDTRATSPAKDCFDLSKPPRKFVPIPAKYPESYFLHEPDDFQPPDND